MKRRSKLLKLAIWLLVSFFVFSPFNYSGFSFQKISASWIDNRGYTIIDQDETWKKTDNLFFTKKVIIRNNATLRIEKGATIKFSQGGDIYIPSLDVQNGNIVAEGTQEEKIIFTSDTQYDKYAINFFSNNTSGKTSFFRYVEFFNGGYRPSLVMNQSIWNNASADGEVLALNYYSGKVHVENSTFKNNRYGDVSAIAEFRTGNQGDYFEIINSNFEKNSANNIAVVSILSCYNGINCANKFLLKNNWYASPNGPTTGSYLILGKKISGWYKLDGFRTKDLIADPVIVIPGILGSAQFGKNKEWKLDPITHTYADLISSFEMNGYEKDKNLFEFPYDWRRSNAGTALDLKNKIAEVLNNSKVSKADLAAHSMGGLVARQYIESADYANNVDQLVTLGTPQKGSPWSYLVWEGGEIGDKFDDFIIKRIFINEAKENGYDDLQKYIQEKIISVKELLPDYDYLFDIAGNAKEYPRNGFLEDLNSSANVANLHKVDFTSIVGNVRNAQSTISKIRVISSSVDGIWEHGMPENFYDTNSDRGLEYDRGDETVPKFSAETIPANRTIEVDAAHSDLPTMAECEVIQELTKTTQCRHVNNVYIPNIFMINVFSPIDIQVISPSGKRVGKDFANGNFLAEISGAYYSGYDTNTEFITIPNPEDGEYKILTQGTGDGEYRIEATKISENANDPKMATESTATLSGNAETGKMGEESMTINGNEVIAKIKDSVSPTISGSATTSPNANGWYNSDVTVHFEASDNESGIESVSGDMVLSAEGANQSAT